jgi:hypothetical protein
LWNASRSYSFLSYGHFILFGLTDLIIIHHLLTACDLTQHHELWRFTRRLLHHADKLVLREVLQLILEFDYIHHYSKPNL